MTSKTLYLLITCCVEQTRYDVLERVVANLKEQQRIHNFNIEDDLIVFDNGSTVPNTLELLTSNFKQVLQSNSNEGFWSAINWVLAHGVDKKYEYIYVIESDHIHFALHKLSDIEKFLDTHPNIGGVRAQEFVVAEKHLYSKSNPHVDSRKYAWVNQRNHITGAPIKFEQTSVPDFYETDFLSQLHSVNRIQPFKVVFNALEKQSRLGQKFSEFDYQKQYAELYPKFGIIDGGLFHAKLTWCTGVVAGSFITTGVEGYNGPMNPAGYQETRVSIITPPEQMIVLQRGQ